MCQVMHHSEFLVPNSIPLWHFLSIVHRVPSLVHNGTFRFFLMETWQHLEPGYVSLFYILYSWCTSACIFGVTRLNSFCWEDFMIVCPKPFTDPTLPVFFNESAAERGSDAAASFGVAWVAKWGHTFFEKMRRWVVIHLVNPWNMLSEESLCKQSFADACQQAIMNSKPWVLLSNLLIMKRPSKAGPAHWLNY